MGYNKDIIKNFAHKGLEKFFLTGSKAGIQPRHATRIRLILAQLNQARSVQDMNIPTLKLHQLKGSRQGTWAVTVQANWRITFRFISRDAQGVNYEDYH
jgi:proteic killer suppression protein